MEGICNMMVGREKEREFLRSLVNEEDPQFVAVFGRRRIGKTYLVRESFDYHFTFEHTGASPSSLTEKSYKRMQLDKFAESLAEAGFRYEKPLFSWTEAFACLKEVIKASPARKKVIFIDELSWMDSKGSGLVAALESFWNGWATARREKDIVLIVCASATYWMLDNIVNSKGGLHNRLTGQINLKPFTLNECEAYLQSRGILMSRHQVLQCYMVLGGVPYYWSLLQKGKSLPQNIDELFFREGALLQNEYENLYRALFSKPDQYIRIIEALAAAGNGLSRSQIAKGAGIASSGDLTRKLAELENCGFVRTYVPFGGGRNGRLYQLIDNYTLFYFKFLTERTHDDHYWQNNAHSSRVSVWSGIAFERICLEHVPQMKRALGIFGVSTEVNSWRCSADPEMGIHGSQIDLLIVRKDQVINVCEMKYAESDFIVNAKFDRDMKRKLADFQIKTSTRYALHPTLVTTYGVEPSAYANEIQAVITADDLFAEA